MEEEKVNIVHTAIEAGKKLADIQSIPEKNDLITNVLVPEGMVIVPVDPQLSPLRKKGKQEFQAVKSFCEYVNKHKKEGETIIIANEDQGKVKAVLNDHGIEPGFGDFCAYLDLGFSKQFSTWLAKSFNVDERNKFTQGEFADFIENNRTDLMVGDIERGDEVIKNLSGLQLTDLINNLQFSAEVNLTAKRNQHDDQQTFEYEVKDSGKCEFKLPKSIFLATPVYRYGGLFRIELRLRSSGRTGGQPRFWYIIDQLELLKEKAFDQICDAVKNGNKGSEEDENKQFDGTGIEVWKGIL